MVDGQSDDIADVLSRPRGNGPGRRGTFYGDIHTYRFRCLGQMLYSMMREEYHTSPLGSGICCRQ
jgi:hypothetical protein